MRVRDDTRSLPKYIVNIPKVVVSLLLVAAIANLLVGVFLRYVIARQVTDWLDVDPVRFTWVEEVGEMMLAWLTLIGAAIGVPTSAPTSHCMCSFTPATRAQLWIHRFNHALIAGRPLAAWYGFKLCLLNRTLMTPGLEINLAWLYASCGGRRHPDRRLRHRDVISPPPQGEPSTGGDTFMLLRLSPLFVVLILLSMPIVFALGVAGVAGLWIGGYPLQMLSSALVSGSQSWVLLAIPAFVFAGNLMERCGMSHALVDFARALVGWVKGGLGMSVIVVAYFFSDICGSKMAEVSALGSTLMPPLTRAGYDRRDRPR